MIALVVCIDIVLSNFDANSCIPGQSIKTNTTWSSVKLSVKYGAGILSQTKVDMTI